VVWITEYISLQEMKQGQCICPLSWSGEYTATLLVVVNVMNEGWACTPHPHQARLILLSWLNVRQKAGVTTLCTLWSGCFNLWLISSLLFLPARIHTKQKCWESDSNQDLFSNIFYGVWILIAYWGFCSLTFMLTSLLWSWTVNCVILIITRCMGLSHMPPSPSPPPHTRTQPQPEC
jgi:hypothetical protein